MRKVLILLIGLFSMLVISCASKAEQTENVLTKTQTAENKLAKTSWQMVSFGAIDNQQQIPERGFEAIIEFSDSTFGGRIVGCNIISFNYTMDGSKITVKWNGTTVMACPKEVMQQEGELKEAFEKAQEFRIDGDQLEITYDTGKVIRAKRATPVSQPK